MIGFEVPGRLLATRNQVTTPSCDHKGGSPGAFCPECGVKKEMLSVSNVKLRPHIKPLLNPDSTCEDDSHDICPTGFSGTGWAGEWGGITIELFTPEDNSGGWDTAYVGFIITNAGDPRYEATREPWKTTRLPSKKELAAFLRKSGIPFDAKTWGLHCIPIVT